MTTSRPLLSSMTTRYQQATRIQLVCCCGIVLFTLPLLVSMASGSTTTNIQPRVLEDVAVAISPSLRSGSSASKSLLRVLFDTPGSSASMLPSEDEQDEENADLPYRTNSGAASDGTSTSTTVSATSTEDEDDEVDEPQRARTGSLSRLDYKYLDFKLSSPDAPKCDPIEPKDVDFTLVTQLTPSRLWIMKHQCKRWVDHPISIAVGTQTSTKVITKALELLGCNMNYVKVTTVGDIESEEDYPVNRLRNVALAGVQTSHAVLMDADFVLSTNAYDHLMNQKGTLASDHKTALVVPVFELRSLCDASDPDCKMIHEGMLPNTKAELLDIFTSPALDATIAQFDVKGNAVGHGSTRYLNWINQDADTLLPIECITSPRYEPYLAFRYCQDLPPFQEAFTGYGQNKLTWFQQVRQNGYRLFQLGDAFAIHFPHAKSSAFRVWTQERKQHQMVKSKVKVNRIAESFGRWLEDTVPNQSVIPQC